MNDAEREISQMLIDAEKELTALKTAHQRPLGALDFFSLTQQIIVDLEYSYGAYDRTFWIDVKIQESDVKPPICQVGWDDPPNFIPMDLWESNISDDYTTFSYKFYIGSPDQARAVFNATAISSMPIVSITRRYV